MFRELNSYYDDKRPRPTRRLTVRGREWRAVRSERYTYARDRRGPWLLFDNQADPYQMKNLVNQPEHADVQKELDGVLQQKLEETDDCFEEGMAYIKKWGYPVDETLTVPFEP